VETAEHRGVISPPSPLGRFAAYGAQGAVQRTTARLLHVERPNRRTALRAAMAWRGHELELLIGGILIAGLLGHPELVTIFCTLFVTVLHRSRANTSSTRRAAPRRRKKA
jgi:hypothetical protein